MRRRSPMRVSACALLVVATSLASSSAEAQQTKPISAEPSPASRGLIVIALEGAADATWPLARGVYADDALRPAGLDEPHARVLAGEAPQPDATRDLTDLAQTRAAVRGDDAPSRQLLATLCNSFQAMGAVVVDKPHGAQARVFVARLSAFDAARYAADPTAPSTWGGGGPTVAWTGAIESLRRSYGQGAPAEPTIARQPTPSSSSPPRPDTAPTPPTPFYLSPWFWGAVGAAAFAAGAIYFATRDNGSQSIHLQVQVPK